MTKPKQKSARLEDTRFAINELKEDLKKQERVYKLLIHIEHTDVLTYKIHDKILYIESLIFILQSSLKDMGGK